MVSFLRVCIEFYETSVNMCFFKKDSDLAVAFLVYFIMVCIYTFKVVITIWFCVQLDKTSNLQQMKLLKSGLKVIGRLLFKLLLFRYNLSPWWLLLR